MSRKMNFTLKSAAKKATPTTRRPNTLRARCELLLSGHGATFEDVVNLVSNFDLERNKKPQNLRRRAYELIRIMHYHLGHNVVSENGVIRLTDQKETKNGSKKLPPAKPSRVRKAPAKKR